MDHSSRVAAALGRPLSAEQQQQALHRYAELLARAATRLNLTAVRDVEGIERRHVHESLALLRVLEGAGVLPAGAAVVDVGSGGGVPGIPIAVVRPDLRVTLLEATAKKGAFLEETVRALALANLSVLTARAEDAGRDAEHRERYDAALARAVAPLDVLAELTLPLVRPGGCLAAVKGSRVHEELAAAAAAITRCGGRLNQVEPLPLAGAEPLSVVLVAKVTSTPPELPRRAGMPAKRPLR